MTELNRYARGIERRLRVDRATRRRIMNDLNGDLQSRAENGQTLEEICAELGTPAEVAAEFNEVFAEQNGPYKSPWRWAFLALAVLLAVVELLLPVVLELLAGVSMVTSPAETASVGVIGGADGPTAIFVATGTSARGWLPWLVALIGVYLMLGWCRGGRRRLWVPILLCGVMVLLWTGELLMAAGLLLHAGAIAATVLQSTVKNLFTTGTWLCAVLLAWSVHTCRKMK